MKAIILVFYELPPKLAAHLRWGGQAKGVFCRFTTGPAPASLPVCAVKCVRPHRIFITKPARWRATHSCAQNCSRLQTHKKHKKHPTDPIKLVHLKRNDGRAASTHQKCSPKWSTEAVGRAEDKKTHPNSSHSLHWTAVHRTANCSILCIFTAPSTEKLGCLF